MDILNSDWLIKMLEKSSQTPHERLLGLFDVLDDWLEAPNIREQVRNEFSATTQAPHLRDFLTAEAAKAGAAMPEMLANQLYFMAVAATQEKLQANNHAYMRHAKNAANALISAQTKKAFRITKREARSILFGLLFTFVGLVIFLVGVNAGFMKVGSDLGYQLADKGMYPVLILVGLSLGVVTIMAEPAVYVLTDQIEEVTSGYVKKKVVLFTLAIGVGIAVALSIIRILIPQLELWQYLLPGYLIAILLTYITPKLFVGIAFDSGGVASGPMTATFILAYTQGAAQAIDGADVIVDGFGVIAMVAMTPLIMLQILGLIFKLKSRRREGK